MSRANPGRAGTDLEDVTLYLVTRFASQGKRRLVQLSGLRDSLGRVRVVSQRKGGTYDDEDPLWVNVVPGPTSFLSPIGLDALRQRIDRHLYFPSSGVRYARAAQAVVETEIRAMRSAGRSSVVVTMVPPHDLLAMGLDLKRRNPQTAWIIDWGDLWTHDAYYFERLPRRLRPRARRLEERSMAACDANVVSNRWAARFLIEEHGISPDRVTAIPHAFEPGDQRLAPAVHPPCEGQGPVRLGFLGGLFKPPKVPGEEIVRGLERVREMGLDLELNVVGDLQLIHSAAFGSNGGSWVKVHPPLPHDRSLELVERCDFLFLALADMPNCRLILPAKLPPYLALNRPILAVVPDPSATAEAIEETGAGYVVPMREGWWRDLAETIHAHARDSSVLQRRPDRIGEYSYSRFADQWRDTIARVLR